MSEIERAKKKDNYFKDLLKKYGRSEGERTNSFVMGIDLSNCKDGTVVNGRVLDERNDSERVFGNEKEDDQRMQLA